MASKDVHKSHINEHLQELADAIALGKEKRPATIALHVSACSIDLLELYLHCLGKVQLSQMIKHQWFKAPKQGQKIAPLAERKLLVEFPHKQELLSEMYIIEELRNKLIYGKPTIIALNAILQAFDNIHELIKTELENNGEEIG